MNNPTKDLLSLAGRVMIATIFLLAPSATRFPTSQHRRYMESDGVPSPRVVLAGAISS